MLLSAVKTAPPKPAPPRSVALKEVADTASTTLTQSRPGEYETMDGISKLKTQLKVRRH